MTSTSVTGHFIAGAKGRVFVLARIPAKPIGSILIVPPFAEEMNKCRRMMAQTSQRLSDLGYAVILPDLHGTGDSDGEFAHACAAVWCADLHCVGRWAVDHEVPITGLLAVRLGAALTVAAAAEQHYQGVIRTVVWQPVFDGARHLQQFLRLRTAASMNSARPESVAELSGRIAGGETLEVAGYKINGILAAELERMAAPPVWPRALGCVHWLEVSRNAGSPLPPPSEQLIERWRQSLTQVDVQRLMGEPYWASTEIVSNTSLIEATVAAFIASEVPASNAVG